MISNTALGRQYRIALLGLAMVLASCASSTEASAPTETTVTTSAAPADGVDVVSLAGELTTVGLSGPLSDNLSFSGTRGEPSPDGRALYYTADGAAGTTDIHRVDLDGSNDVVVVTSGYSPRVSASGTMAFSQPGPDGSSSALAVREESGEVRVLIDEPNTFAEALFFGGQTLFAVTVTNSPTEQEFSYWAIDPSTGDRRAVPTVPVAASPDGSQVATVHGATNSLVVLDAVTLEEISTSTIDADVSDRLIGDGVGDSVTLTGGAQSAAFWHGDHLVVAATPGSVVVEVEGDELRLSGLVLTSDGQQSADSVVALQIDDEDKVWVWVRRYEPPGSGSPALVLVRCTIETVSCTEASTTESSTGFVSLRSR